MKTKKKSYIDCYEKIYNFIKDNNYKSNDKLPSESELSKMFGVNRMTLRQALFILTEDDIIKKVQGKGNFVQGIKEVKHQGLECLKHPIHSFCKESIKHVDIDTRFEVSSEYMKNIFGFDSKKILSICDRWYLSDSSVYAFSFSAISVSFLDQIKIDLESKSELLDFIETNIYKMAYKSKISIKHPKSSDFISQKYKFDEGSNILLIKEIIYSNVDDVCVYNKFYLQSEFFDIFVNSKTTIL